MTRLILAIAGVTAIVACSNARDRQDPAGETANRPLAIAPLDSTVTADSSTTVSPRNEQAVSTVEQQVVKSGTNAPARPRKASRKRHRPVPPPAPAEDSASTRAYAPNSSSDPGVTPPRDSATSGDTATVVHDTATFATDTAATRPEAVTTRAPDTVAGRSADATSTTRADSMVAGDTASTVEMGPATTPGAPAARTLPIGTEIHAALDDSINSRTDTAGRTVTAQVMENVTGSDGKTLLAAGTPVQFTVTRLRPARSKGSKGALVLRVDGIAVNGQLEKVTANVQPIPQELRGRGVTGSEAAKVGVGAAGGAVLGRVIGGNTKGAVIGGVVGAAGGAVVASQTATRDVMVKARTPVVFVLTAPMVAGSY